MKNINRFGEIYFNKNEALITMPFNRLNVEETETLEENYRNKVKELGHPDSFIYAEHFSTIRDRLQMSFDLDGCVDFHNIRNYKLRNMLPFLYSMVDLAQQDANILWQKQNMVVDLTEQRVKALLFEFEGFNIYKKDNNLDGLKEIILLALTKNDSILVKPKRADFIQKENDVYQFSDDILSASSIDEIYNTIASYEREVEYQDRKAAQEEEEKKQNSFLYKAKSKLKPKSKEKTPDEALKEQLQNEAENEAGTSDKKPKSFLDKITEPIPMVSIIGVVLVMAMFSVFDISGTASGKTDEEQIIDKQDKILEAYRLYINGDDEQKEQAFAKLDAIGYNQLPEDDQDTLIDWYIQQDKYTKALNVAPNSAYQVSDDIFNKNFELADSNKEAKKMISKELKELTDSFPDNKVLQFDIARAEGNDQAMVENSHLPKYDKKRAKAVVKAHVTVNQIDELKKLMDEYKDDKESDKALRDQYNQNIDDYKEKKKLEEKIDDLNEKISNKKDKKENADDDDKKENIQNDIDNLQDDLKQKKENLKNINNSLKNNN